MGLPVIFDIDAMAYGDFTVRQHDDGRLEALGEVPDRCAFSRHLLESAEHPAVTWDGKRITVTLSNGSWSWVAEAQDPTGSIVYGGPTRPVNDESARSLPGEGSERAEEGETR